MPTIEEVREDEEDGEDAEGLRTAEGLKETGNELFKGGEYEKSLVSCRIYYFFWGGGHGPLLGKVGGPGTLGT